MPLFHTVKGFFSAAEDGNEDLVRKYFGWDGIPKYAAARDSDGNTGIHKAARGGLYKVIDALADAGCDVNERNASGETALMPAIAYQHIDAVKALLARGADPNIADARGNLPLDTAISTRNPAFVKTLIEAKADVNNPNRPLLRALQYGSAEAADMLLAAGAKPDTHAGDYRYPIHFAAQCGALDAMKTMIAAGVDINVRDNQGQTPLHYAVIYGNVMSIEFLLQHGADTSIENAQGKTPLAVEQERKYSEQIVKLLEKAETSAPVAPQAKPAAPAQPPQQSADDGDSEKWLLMGASKAAHVGVYPALNRKITEIFNFQSRERLIITENLKTGAETMGQPEKFDALPEEAVSAATAAFANLGGKSGGDTPQKKSFVL